MELKYSKDISWHDLPRIIRPSIASDFIEDDLDAPYPQITYSIKEHKFNKIYDSNSRYVDEYELSKLFEKMERGEIYLVKSSSKETFAPLFIWRENKSSKDKGQWEISNPFGGFGSSQIELLLNTVKKPPSGGGGSKPTQTPPPLFPGANTADTQRAVANTGIETVNTATSSARNRELAEHAERYPQLQSGADKNPLEIDKLKYDDDAFGEFAETMAGVGGILATRNPSNIISKSGKKNSWGTVSVENLNNKLDRLRTEGHAIERHGGTITDDQLYRRAQTGIAPDGSRTRRGYTPISTAFHNDELLVQSDDYLRANYLDDAIKNAEPGTLRIKVTADTNNNIGRGYLPVGKRTGLQGPLHRADNLTAAEGWYVYDPVNSSWQTNTIYPIPGK